MYQVYQKFLIKSGYDLIIEFKDLTRELSEHLRPPSYSILIKGLNRATFGILSNTTVYTILLSNSNGDNSWRILYVMEVIAASKSA